MNYTNAQEHVPQAERNNRTIKERIRAALHRLPYKKIPKNHDQIPGNGTNQPFKPISSQRRRVKIFFPQGNTYK